MISPLTFVLGKVVDAIAYLRRKLSLFSLGWGTNLPLHTPSAPGWGTPKPPDKKPRPPAPPVDPKS